MTIVGRKDEPRAQSLHALARALPARYKRLEWLDLREGSCPTPTRISRPRRARRVRLQQPDSARFRPSMPRSFRRP